MDPVQELIRQEEVRQTETLQLIPSENHASRAVREALGSVLVNKYSEGYPDKRYYQGNGIVDEIEKLAQERAKKLFGAVHANVQPYSGSPANAAVLFALLDPGDRVMGLKLSGGGHLTHGHPGITFSGRYFQPVQFDVDADGRLDYGEIEKLAAVEKPKMIIAGTTAYPRFVDWEKFAGIAERAGAWLVADISHIAGLVAGGVHPGPAGFAHVITTTTHKTLRGPRGAMILVTEKGLAKDAEVIKKIDRAVFPGLQGGPHDNTTAAIAVALGEADTPEFHHYAERVVENARVLAEKLSGLGMKLTTGGTDNHLMVADLTGQNISGKEAAVGLEKAGLVVNYNAVPHDSRPPANPSGIRLGTPAVTTRGMGKAEMEMIAEWIYKVISGADPERIRLEVRDLGRKYPAP